MKKSKQSWYREWFDSEHYDKLYQHRDQEEAREFIIKLFGYLNLSSSSRILDLACGKGRHSIQVNSLGYRVVGIDLSEENINHASQFEGDQLEFDRGDMRNLPYLNDFDLVLNLFTSFGYFEKEAENKAVVESISRALRVNGLLVLDFLNVKKVRDELPSRETIVRDNIAFDIEKYVENESIVKKITYQHLGKQQVNMELVKMIDLPLFRSYFENADLKLRDIFGDYQLRPFDEKDSDRLIMIAEKTTK